MAYRLTLEMSLPVVPQDVLLDVFITKTTFNMGSNDYIYVSSPLSHMIHLIESLNQGL